MAGMFLTVALMAALVQGVMVAKGLEGSWPGALVKTLSVALLAAEAVVLGAPAWIVAGLALGAVGDFALTRAGERAFLAGMAAFGLGHLAYAVGFAQGGVPGWIGALPLPVMFGLVAWWLARDAGRLRGPVGAYGVVIGAMAAVVVAMPHHTGWKMVALGVALFVASDLLLAVRLFRPGTARRAWAFGLALWPLYWLGQALILIGSLIYWDFPKS